MKSPYYAVPNFRLYHGKCMEIMKEMPDSCVDMVFADPPYYLSNGGFTVQSGKAVSVNKGEWDKSHGHEKDLESYSEWIKEIRRILKPHGTIWISGTYHSIYLCGYALIREGYKILNDISWSKPNAAPNLSGRYFAASHETLLWAKKDPKAKHTFNYELMRNGHWPEDRFKVPNKQMKSVWSLNTPTFKEKIHGKHPTQKPLKLLERIILASTNEGDLVLDPFTGSSTTGLAAHLWGRKFVGIDTEKEYLDLSIKRHKDILKAGATT